MTPYNSPFPATYNPYQNYYPTPNIPQHQELQPDTNMIWVQGDSGAKAYPVQNGKSVVLFDSEEKRFFIKAVDVNGMPLPLKVFNYSEAIETEDTKSEIDTSQFITRDEFDEVISSLKNKSQQQNQQQKNNGGNKHGKPTVQ